MRSLRVELVEAVGAHARTWWIEVIGSNKENKNMDWKSNQRLRSGNKLCHCKIAMISESISRFEDDGLKIDGGFKN